MELYSMLYANLDGSRVWGRRDTYIYMYGWIPSLFNWNYHNIVNQLYPNTKKKFKV